MDTRKLQECTISPPTTSVSGPVFDTSSGPIGGATVTSSGTSVPLCPGTHWSLDTGYRKDSHLPYSLLIIF